MRFRIRIKDETYYRNFVSLAKQIAPDGVDINLVGFTSWRRGRERTVHLNRPMGTARSKFDTRYTGNALKITRPQKNGRSLSVTIHRRNFAQCQKKVGFNGRISLEDDKGTCHTIRVVPSGMMSAYC